MAYYSPLRYPGGKAAIYPLMRDILRANDLSGCDYVEPFAGGCGLALSLLMAGDVRRIVINDFDRAIWAFWFSVLHHTDDLIKRINQAVFTLDEWRSQKAIHAQDDSDVLNLGFATFYLNRTNRSGILKGGIIGGLKQEGVYKMDCRFNREALIKRIRLIASRKNDIVLFNQDALEFLDYVDVCEPKAVLGIDPPYYAKGKELYTNFYTHKDHAGLAAKIHGLKRPWVLTYDNVDEIKRLYDGYDLYEFDIRYSVMTKRKADELMVASHGLKVPDMLRRAEIA